MDFYFSNIRWYRLKSVNDKYCFSLLGSSKFESIRMREALGDSVELTNLLISLAKTLESNVRFCSLFVRP